MEASVRTRDTLQHAPDKADTALLLIDVINDLEFDGGERLLAQARPMATCLAALKRRAKAAGLPAIYANDNFGRWRSDFPRLVQYCLENNVRGQELVALLKTCAGLPPDAVADRVEAAVLAASEGRLRDDMAILAFGPTPRPKENDG